MRIILCLCLLGLSICLRAQNNQPVESLDSTNFDIIYPHALRGELDQLFNLLENSNDHNLTANQTEAKEKYYSRFIYMTESSIDTISDTLILELNKRFKNYWRSVMVEKVNPEIADSLFFIEMIHYLKVNFKPDSSIQYLKANYYWLYQDFLNERGFFGLVLGKTGHLFDLYLWTDEREVLYEVELPESSVKIPVVFMSSFISNGWSHYTTYGKSFSGGWVGKEKIYCVAEAYDVESEEFLVSYVAHEGQHFVDLTNYPNLKQADLEYRAKLSEVVLAEKSMFNVIKKFITNSKNDKSYAHAYANHLIISNLSEKVFKEKFVNDIARWKSVEVAKLQRIAMKLLKSNSEKLKKNGPETESLILN